MFVNSVLEAIDAATGLDLVDWVAETQNALNGISAAFQQSWLSFQNLLNGIVQETDADVAAAVAWLQGVGTAANNALTQIEDFLTTGDWSDLTVAYNELVQAIFGTSTSLGLVGEIPAPAVVDVVQNLQPVFDFPDAGSVSAGGQWSWDGTVDHTGVTGSGSAKVVANGTLQAMRGVPGAVQPAQVVTASAWVSWSGLTASGSPIQLQLVPSSNSGSSTLLAGSPVTVASITSPASSGAWTHLTGTYTVPSSGVDAVQLRLVVTATATAGSVWWDDCQADVSGGFLADLKSDTNTIIGSFAPGGTSGQFVTGVTNLLALVGLTPASVGGATNLTTLWTAIINDFINPLNAIEQSAISGLTALWNSIFGTTTPTTSSLLQPGAVANVLGGANLGADVSSVHSTATTNTTNIASQQAWWNSLATDLWIYADLFHAYYPVGTPSDTATTTSGGRRTWYSAIADMKVLFATIGSSPPVISATDVGGAVTTAQSTATSAQSTATTANTAAGTAQTTANTANTMFGLGQQAGTNLVLAPGFESTAAWTSASAGTQSTVQAHSGTNSWLLQGTGAGNTTTLRLINSSAGPTALKSRAGEVFQMQAFIYPKTGNAGGGTVAVQIVCTDSTGVNSPTTIVAATETVPATGSWSSLSGTASVPAGYDTVDPQLILSSVPTTDFVYADDVLVRETTLVTTAQSTASSANTSANAALTQLMAVPQQTVVPNLTAGASSVAFGNAGSGGSTTGAFGSITNPLIATGTQTVGSTASVIVAAATFSLVGSGSVNTASMNISIGNQQMQNLGGGQVSSATEYLRCFMLWNPRAGTKLPVTATAYNVAGSGGIGSVSFESASYIGATGASTVSTNSGSGTSLTLSVPSAVAGTRAVAAFSAGNVLTKANTALSGFTQTQRGNTTVQLDSGQYGFQSLAFGDAAGASGVTFGATAANTAGWVGAAIVLSATSVLGSGLRLQRTSTATAAPSAGNQTLGLYDSPPQYLTSDLSLSGSAATVTIAGWYMATISQLEAAVTTVHQARVLLYQNGSVVQQGQTLNVTTTASNTWIMQGTLTVYCSAGDRRQPGEWYSTGPGFALTGEATGTCTYWEMALVNRSLL